MIPDPSKRPQRCTVSIAVQHEDNAREAASILRSLSRDYRVSGNGCNFFVDCPSQDSAINVIVGLQCSGIHVDYSGIF